MPLWYTISYGEGPGSAEQVLTFVLPEVNFVFHEFLGCQQSGIRHFLVSLGDLDLLLVLMDLFQAVSMGGELLQLVVQFLLQHDVDLVGAFGDHGNGLVYITGFALDLGHILGLKVISNTIAYLPAKPAHSDIFLMLSDDKVK